MKTIKRKLLLETLMFCWAQIYKEWQCTNYIKSKWKIAWYDLWLRTKICKICNIVNQKLNALHRIANHVSRDKLKMLSKTFIESQFSYCPLILMFYPRILNNKINRLQEKAWRIVYSNFKTKYDDFTEKDGSFIFHCMNIQTLGIEIHAFFISNNFTSNTRLKLAKNQTKTKQHPEA